MTTPSQFDASGAWYVRAVVVVCILAAAAAFGAWAMSDRNWERTWKDRIRVETPLGADKDFVLSWIGRHCDVIPHVDSVCHDAVGGIPIVRLAGIDESSIASFSRITVFRKDLAAGDRDHMQIYHFYGSDNRVVGHFYLPFHEVASFEVALRVPGA